MAPDSVPLYTGTEHLLSRDHRGRDREPFCLLYQSRASPSPRSAWACRTASAATRYCRSAERPRRASTSRADLPVGRTPRLSPTLRRCNLRRDGGRPRATPLRHPRRGPGRPRFSAITVSEWPSRGAGPVVPERLRERHWQGFRRVMETGASRYDAGDRARTSARTAAASLEFASTSTQLGFAQSTSSNR
jgi:hypothetical protein